MTWIIIPATDRARARAFVARLDAAMGYPRTHARDEPGLVLHERSPAPRTETLCMLLRHDATGPAQLHGAVAILIDESTRKALRDRRVTIDGVTRSVARWVEVLGWQARASLPGAPTTIYEVSPWSQLPPRDGAAGSATGVPIPAIEDEPNTEET